MSSWAQQREAIRRAAQGGVRARTNAQGSQRLPLANNRLREVLLSRPNGELTRAGQFYYGLVGRGSRGAAPHPRGADGLHPPPLGGQEGRALIAARRQLPPHQAGQVLLPGEVHGLAGARPRAHHRHPSAGPQRRPTLPARRLSAHHSGQRFPIPAVQRAQRSAGPRPRQGGRPEAAGQPQRRRPDHGAQPGSVPLRRHPGLGVLQADPGGRGQQGPGAGRAAAAHWAPFGR